jgi:hypothetical protein
VPGKHSGVSPSVQLPNQVHCPVHSWSQLKLLWLLAEDALLWLLALLADDAELALLADDMLLALLLSLLALLSLVTPLWLLSLSSEHVVHVCAETIIRFAISGGKQNVRLHASWIAPSPHTTRVMMSQQT